jgi:hypothetical protein
VAEDFHSIEAENHPANSRRKSPTASFRPEFHEN